MKVVEVYRGFVIKKLGAAHFRLYVGKHQRVVHAVNYSCIATFESVEEAKMEIDFIWLKCGTNGCVAIEGVEIQDY